MRVPPLDLDAVAQCLLARGAPPDYVARLLAELAEHRADLVDELLAAGAAHSIEAAARAADRRLGSSTDLAAAALDGLRRSSFVGRHPCLCLVAAPAAALPLLWALLLGTVAGAAGMLSTGFRAGAAPAWAVPVLRAACGACVYVLPAAAALTFHALARRRFLGRGWSVAPFLVLAGLSSVVFVEVFSIASGPGRGRLVLGAAVTPDPLRLLIPLAAGAVLLALRRSQLAHRAPPRGTVPGGT